MQRDSMSVHIASIVLILGSLMMQGAESRCASHSEPKDTRCSGCPPMLNGKLCASTTRYNDQTKAACGCGPSDPVPTNWWTLTQFTAALNAASLNPENPLLGWCPTGCGACYELCTTGGTTQGQPTTPGICRSFKITNRCADGYGEYPEWCSNSMSWQACQADAAACGQLGSTNKFGYPAHFDMQDFHGQVHNFSWDNVEVTFEPVPCSQWNGPGWDCECAAGGSKKCEFWCSQDASNPWSTKCAWSDCRGCSECTTTSHCASWCSQDSHTWSAKCGWGDCQACTQCATPTMGPQAQCASWCSQAPQPWSEKCTWDGCNSCTECVTTTRMLDQGCAWWCSRDSHAWFTKCAWSACQSCSDCVASTTVDACALEDQDCRKSRCCSNAAMLCYEKDQYWSSCRESCEPGAINPKDPPEFQTPWSCALLPMSTTSTTVVVSGCSGLVEDCRLTRCCSDPALTCYEKNRWWSECKGSCAQGIDVTDAPEFRTPWSCTSLSATTTSTAAVASGVCSGLGENCRTSKCCTNPDFICFEKDQWWAACRPSCAPGIDMSDVPKFQTPWSCAILSATTISTTVPASPSCSDAGEDCRATRCCTNPELTCFEKDQWWAQCTSSCVPGVRVHDWPQTPWSCTILQDDGASRRLRLAYSQMSELVENIYFSI